MAADPHQLDRMNPLGASLHADGTTFRVWAPSCRSVELVVDGRPPERLRDVGDGVRELTLTELLPGARYQYRLDGERYRPDPVSRWQPQGVHGPSVVVDPTRFAWTDQRIHGPRAGRTSSSTSSTSARTRRRARSRPSSRICRSSPISASPRSS